MFKIGDFSRLAQVSVRMLRYYDALGLLKPRQTDPWTGYRFYTIDQLARLNRIVALNGLGLTLQQITELLNVPDGLSADQLRGMLLVRQADLAHEIHAKEAQLARVAARLRQIEQEGQPSPYDVVVKPVAPVMVAALRQVVPSLQQMEYFCRMMYAQVYHQIEHHTVAAREPEVTLYYTEAYTEDDLDVEVTVPIDSGGHIRAHLDHQVVIAELPGIERAAAVVYEGTYRELGAAVLALFTWVGTHNFGVVGPLRELHLSGRAHRDGRLQEPAVLELQVPIAQRVER